MAARIPINDNDLPPENKPDLIDTIVEVTAIMYYNPENTWAILACHTEKSRLKNPKKPFTFKGKVCEPPTKGMKYHVTGYHEKDKRGEHVLMGKSCEPSGDRTREGWVQYLLREGPHIGDARAEHLYDAFGDAVVEAIADSITNVDNRNILLAMDGMTPERADELSAWAAKEKYLSRVKAWLYKVGVTPANVTKIIIRFGKDTPRIVQKDTFQLMDVSGISFKTVDTIAQKVGMCLTDKRRIEEGILYTIQTFLEEGGHTCMHADRLIRHTHELLSVPAALIQTGLDTLRETGRLCTNHTPIYAVTKRHHLFQGNSNGLDL